MLRYQIRLTGWVQGVGLRWFINTRAAVNQCTGWVQNQWDGSVLCELQGEKSNVDAVLKEIRQGNQFIVVEQMEIHEIPTQTESGFHIR